MKKLYEFLKRLIPLYCWIPLISCFTFNCVVYSGAKIIAGDWYHYNIETSLDRAIPFIPATLLIYFGCYIFWALNYIMIASLDTKRAYRFCSADFLAKVVCLIFFLAWPTTNVRPDVPDTGLWNVLMRLLYSVDAADNLFPSIHCLTSWFCYIGMRGDSRIPKWYRVFSCLFAIAVFISTLTTKQHVIADVIGGVLLAEVMYFITGHTAVAEKYGKLLKKITCLVFRGEEIE